MTNFPSVSQRNVPHTCKTIDTTIGNLWDITNLVTEAKGRLEKLRGANSALREAAEAWEEYAYELENQNDDLKAKVARCVPVPGEILSL